MQFSYILDPPSQFKSFGEFADVVAGLARLGYQGIEFTLTCPLGFEPRELHALLDKHQLRMASFLSGWSYFNEGLCLSAGNPSIRERAVARLREYVDVAADFGAILVIGQMQGFLKDEPDVRLAQERIAACLGQVAQHAESKQVTVVLEPVNHLQVGFNHRVADVREMVDRVGSRALKPMIDTLHMNIEEHDLLRAMADVRADVSHVHLCETNGGTFGTGHMDFKSVLDALAASGYSRIVSVKIYRGRQPLLEDAAHAMDHYLARYRG